MSHDPVRPPDDALRAAVRAEQDLIAEVMAFVHAHPELGHEEQACARFLADQLASAGLLVTRQWAGMKTALRAELAGARPGRTVGLVLVYDAVPAHGSGGQLEPDHSCGHGAIAAGVLGAARALARYQPELAGRIVVLGCPADEIHAPRTASGVGGKAQAAASGACDDLDAALYAHPEYIDAVWTQSRWMQREQALVVAARRLAAGEPQPASDALRAALDAGQAAPADVMLERLELDGDVEEGCRLVARLTFLVFADTEPGLRQAVAALRGQIPGAAWSSIGPAYAGIKVDPAVAAAATAGLRAAGRSAADAPPPLPFATDFGNVSQRVPAALIGVGRPAGWAFHTDDGARQFASSEGLASATAIAEVLALTAVRLT